MAHGLQIVEEFKTSKPTEAITLAVSTTKYLNLSPLSKWDTVHGIWFFMELQAVGTDNVTIQLQGAVDPNQTTWTDVGAAISHAVGASIEQITFERAPLVKAAASPFTSLYPFMRLKFTTPNNSVLAVYTVNRTIRGLS